MLAFGGRHKSYRILNVPVVATRNARRVHTVLVGAAPGFFAGSNLGVSYVPNNFLGASAAAGVWQRSLSSRWDVLQSTSEMMKVEVVSSILHDLASPHCFHLFSLGDQLQTQSGEMVSVENQLECGRVATGLARLAVVAVRVKTVRHHLLKWRLLTEYLLLLMRACSLLSGHDCCYCLQLTIAATRGWTEFPAWVFALRSGEKVLFEMWSCRPGLIWLPKQQQRF